MNTYCGHGRERLDFQEDTKISEVKEGVLTIYKGRVFTQI